MSRAKRPLPAERLRELLHYDPETGVFTNRVNRGNRGKAGDVTGTDRGNGYIVMGVEGAVYYAHRLAWLYVTGEWPTLEIDHKDGNPSNNKFTNLRDVSDTVNYQNKRRAKSNSRTGVLGVSRHRDKFIAWICVNGKRVYLGVHPTADAASAAYLAHKRTHHEGCMI
jgi:hypothetical protein